MGYFPNGTSGLDYQERYCSRCVHDAANNCPVWDMHLLFSYELCNETSHPGKVILDALIPEADDHFGNEQCAMFLAKAEGRS